MSFSTMERAARSEVLDTLKLLALLVLVCQAVPAWSIDCVPNGISLSTQAAVDNFQEIHGPCDHIVDHLTIWGDEITNTDGLVDLVSIGDGLEFFEATALIEVTLPNLVNVGGKLEVNSASKLSRFDLGNLNFVGRYLNLIGVPVLTEMDLSSLTFVGEDFWLYYSAALSDVDSLASLIHVGGNVTVSGNPQLRQCRGLTSLLDDTDDGSAGPGSELTDVPDVGGSVSLEANLSGCNSIKQVMTIFGNGFESRFNTVTELDKNIGVTGRTNSIAIGEDGIPVIAYLQEDFTVDSTMLKVARCKDSRCTEADFSLVDRGSGPVFIAIGQDGMPIISYGQDDGLLIAKCNDYYCSGADESISIVDDLGRSGSLAIGVDGLPVISYTGVHSGENRLMVAKCNDPACLGGDESITAINDFEESTGRDPSVATGTDGFPVISYQRITGAFEPSIIKVAKCNDMACSGGDEIISVVHTNGNWMSTFTSIAIGTDGAPVVAYAGTNGSINVVKCNDAACSDGDGSKVVIEETGFMGSAHLTIGQDGFPVISYEDYGIGALKVAKCGDVACLGEIAIAIVDDEHRYESTSIALGEEGLPIISYFDSFARSLKVAHCESMSCQ
jgi:hypothetical protein